MTDRGSTFARALPSLAPTALYVTGEEYLLITSLASLSSVALTISGRMLDVNGFVVPFSDQHVANSDRTAATSVIRIGEGWLTDVTAIVTGASPQIAQAFVRVDVARGDGSPRNILATLLQGNLNAAQRLAWPGTPIMSTLIAPGALRSITGTDPAANTEVSEAVPTGARWRLHHFLVTLVTDANVASRQTTLIIDDGTNTFYRAQASATQPAGTTRNYVVYPAGIAPATNSPDLILPTTPGLLLPAGARLRTSTALIQAGDNYGAPQLLVEEWLEGVA